MTKVVLLFDEIMIQELITERNHSNLTFEPDTQIAGRTYIKLINPCLYATHIPNHTTYPLAQCILDYDFCNAFHK